MSDSARLKSRQEGSDLAAILEGLLADAVEKAPTAGAVLRIESPFIRWEGACGLAAPRKAMRRCDQFQIASITKMITAATAMILVEDGLLDLDRGIGAYLPRAVTGGLHRLGARSYGAELTTRQLLSHTSGVADFFGDGMPSAEGVLPFNQIMKKAIRKPGTA